MSITVHRRAALAACGLALCGALATPAAVEAASAVTGSDHVRTEVAGHVKSPKPPKKPKKLHSVTVALGARPAANAAPGRGAV